MTSAAAKYRSELPQLSDRVFLTDGGLETTLIFQEHLELPEFAAFVLLDHEQGVDALRRYFRTHAAIAHKAGVGFILESATYKASPDWGAKLGYSSEDLAAANRRAIGLLADIRLEFADSSVPMVISGCVGPRGDGYDPAELMSEDEAYEYHSTQVATFIDTEADMVTAYTMTHAEEAIGVTRASVGEGMPVVISFTVETDGTLPSGAPLRAAVETVDAATSAAPAYYMINCAHPTHFEGVLVPGAPWVQRIRGIRANASTKSHAELDEAEELDDGDPRALGMQYARLRSRLSHLTVLGGCCGTDDRHIQEISRACFSTL